MRRNYYVVFLQVYYIIIQLSYFYAKYDAINASSSSYDRIQSLSTSGTTSSGSIGSGLSSTHFSRKSSKLNSGIIGLSFCGFSFSPSSPSSSSPYSSSCFSYSNCSYFYAASISSLCSSLNLSSASQISTPFLTSLAWIASRIADLFSDALSFNAFLLVMSSLRVFSARMTHLNSLPRVIL